MRYPLSLLRKSIVINFGAIIGILLGTAQTIILTRSLGPEGIGQYALSVSALSLAATLFAFGCPLAFLYYAKQSPDQINELFTHAFFILLLAGLISGVTIASIFYLFKGYFGHYSFYALVATALYMPAVLLRVLFRNYLLTKIKAKRLALIELTAAGASIIFVAIAWRLNRLTVNITLFSFVVATIVRAILGWYWIRGEVSMRFTVRYGQIVRLLRMSVRQMGPDLFTMLNDQVGILLLKLMIDDFSQIGFFSRAVSIAAFLIMLSQAVMPVLFSSWAGLPEQSLSGHVEKVLRYVTSFVLVSALGLIGVGQWIVFLLYGHDFLAAVNTMRVLAVGSAFAIVSRTLIQLFGGRGLPERGALFLAVGSVITAILCTLLIPFWGGMGCAVAITIGQFSVMLTLCLHGRSRFCLNLRRCALLNRDEIRHTIKNLYRTKAHA